MYRFEATYIDYATDTELKKTLEIDMCTFSPEDFKGESFDKVAWKWALERAFDLAVDGTWFVRLDLISC